MVYFEEFEVDFGKTRQRFESRRKKGRSWASWVPFLKILYDEGWKSATVRRRFLVFSGSFGFRMKK